MSKIVVTCHPNGSVETLLTSVLDTRKLGHRQIDRITIIEFDEVGQDFHIQWLKGPYAGHAHDTVMDCNILKNSPLPRPSQRAIMVFDTYEEAVAHEIECVNALRLQGISFV